MRDDMGVANERHRGIMDLQAIRDRAKAVGTQFLAVVEMADHPAGWEAVHHGLAALHRDLGAAAEGYDRLRKLAVAHQSETYDGEFDDDDLRGLVAALRAEAKAERRGRVQAENECRAARGESSAAEAALREACEKLHRKRRRATRLAARVETLESENRSLRETAGNHGDYEGDVELKSALYAARDECLAMKDQREHIKAALVETEMANKALRAENAVLRAPTAELAGQNREGRDRAKAERELWEWRLALAAGDDLAAQLHHERNQKVTAIIEHTALREEAARLDDDNQSLRAENDALRQQLEAVRVNRDFQAAITTELRPHRGPSLADVLDALPPGGKLSYEAPAWEETEQGGCCGG